MDIGLAFNGMLLGTYIFDGIRLYLLGNAVVDYTLNRRDS